MEKKLRAEETREILNRALRRPISKPRKPKRATREIVLHEVHQIIDAAANAKAGTACFDAQQPHPQDNWYEVLKKLVTTLRKEGYQVQVIDNSPVSDFGDSNDRIIIAW